MAEGRPIGKVFVELDLSTTEYTRKQKEIIKGAQEAAQHQEQNFRVLGQKSDVMYAAMKQQAVNAYNAIAANAKSSTQEISRAHEAMSRKIEDLNNQQFGKQSSFLDKMKTNWLATTAVIAGSMAAISKGWDLLKMGADIAEQQGLLDNLSKKFNTTADQIVSSMEKASEGLIAKTDLMSTALGGLAKGLNPDQMVKLADAARILGDVVGQNATTALKELSEALESGRTKALKGYAGAAIDLGAAFGDLEGKMTAAEKTQAMYALIMIHATKLQREQTTAVDDTADKLEKLEAQYKNIVAAAATWFKTLVVGTYEVITSATLTEKYALAQLEVTYKKGMISKAEYEKEKARITKQTNKEEQDGNKKTGDEFIKQMEKQLGSLKNVLATRKAGEDAAKDSAAAAKKSAEEAIRANEQLDSLLIKNMGGIEGELAQIDKTYNSLKEKGADLAKLNQYREQATLQAYTKIGQAAEEKAIQEWERESDLAVKITELHLKGTEEYRKMVSEEAEFAATENERQINAIIAKEEEKLRKLQDLYMAGYISFAEYENLKVKIVTNTSAAITEKNIKFAEDAKRAAEDAKRLYREMLLASEDWAAGVQVALQDLAESQKTWAAASAEMTKSLFMEMGGFASEFFFMAITGDLEDIGELFERTWKNLLKTFIDIITEMIIKWLAFKALTAMGIPISVTGGGGGGSSVGSSVVNYGASAAASAGYEYLTGTTIPAYEYAGQALGLMEGTTSGAGGGAGAGAMAAEGGGALAAEGGGGMAAGAFGAGGASTDLAAIGAEMGATEAAAGTGGAGGAGAGAGAATLGAAATALFGAYTIYKIIEGVSSMGMNRQGNARANILGSLGNISDLGTSEVPFNEKVQASREALQTIRWNYKESKWTSDQIKESIDQAFGPGQEELQKFTEATLKADTAMQQLGNGYKEGKETSEWYNTSVKDLRETLEKSEDPVKTLTEVMDNSDYGAKQTTQSFAEMNEQLSGMGEAYPDIEGKLKFMSDTLGLTADQTARLNELFEGGVETADKMDAAIEALSKGLKTDKESAKNLAQEMGLIPPVFGEAEQKALDLANSVAAAGTQFNSTEASLNAMSAAMGLSKEQTAALNAIFKDVKVSAANVDDIIRQLARTLDISEDAARNLATALNLIPKDLQLPTAPTVGGAMGGWVYADGGWLSRHPSGGWINEGSGVNDDVFLGTSGGLNHFGMGREFVVNKRSAAKYGGLLEMINRGYAEGGFVPGKHYTNLLNMMKTPNADYAGTAFGILKLLYGDQWGTTAEREAELSFMPEGMGKELQKWLWQLEDAASAADAQAELAMDRRKLEIELMEAQGKTSEALAAKRADELAAMDASLRPLQQQIWAEEDLKDAREAAAKQAEEQQKAALEALNKQMSLLKTSGFQTKADFLRSWYRLNNQMVALGGGANIPTFAEGGYHSGGWRVVGEKGPELEYTGPSRIFSGGSTAPINDVAVDELSEIRQLLWAIEGSNRKTARILDKFDNDGMPSTRDSETLTTWGN